MPNQAGHSTSNVLYLEKDHAADSWVVNFAENAQADKVYDLFGSYRVPTPFSLKADSRKVRDEIARLNPGNVVVVT